MKRLFSVLLAIAMVLTVLPTAVLAENATEERAPVTALYVGTVNALETPKGAGWWYDADTGILTLSECWLVEDSAVTYTDSYGNNINAIIYVEGDLIVELQGENGVCNYCYSNPAELTSYYGIYAAVYSRTVDGEQYDWPSKLSFQGSGSLYCGIKMPSDATGWSNLGYSVGIFCNADGGADLTGLSSGAKLEIYGGVYDCNRYWNACAWNTAPTFGDNCVVLAYADVGGTVENENGYNRNNNDAWFMCVIACDAYVKSNGHLLLMDEGSASGEGWAWENKVLTLGESTEVKAVSFASGLESAKLVLTQDVTLTNEGLGYDADYNQYAVITAACDLEIDTGDYVLTLNGEETAIRAQCAQLLISGGTVVCNQSEYAFSIDSEGGDVTIRNATFRTTCSCGSEDCRSGELVLADGSDEEGNVVPGGNLLIENAVIDTIAPIYTNSGYITVKDSTVNMKPGYQGIGCSYADILFENSDITISGTGTVVEATYGEIVFDSCNLNLTGAEDEPLLLTARYYESYLDDTDGDGRTRGTADLTTISFLNMEITAPDDVQIGYEEKVDSYGEVYGYVTLKDSEDEFVILLQATANAHSHEHDSYGSDADNHWSVCSCGELVEGSTESHNYVDGACVCGKTVELPNPEKIQGLCVTDTDFSSFTVAWDKGNNVERYWVFVNGVPYISTTDTSLTVTSRRIGTTYTVAVTALLKDGTILPYEGADKLEVATDSFTYQLGCTADVNSITLNWTDNGAEKAWIYLGTDQDALKPVVSSTDTACTLEGLKSNTCYYVKLAFLVDGRLITMESAVSVNTEMDEALCVTREATTVSWNPVGESSKYWICVNGTVMYSTTDTSFTFEGWDEELLANAVITVKGMNENGIYDYYPA